MNTNRDKTINRNRQAIAGVQKHFATAQTLALGASSTTPKDVIATLQAAIDAIDVAVAAEKGFHDATTAQHAAVAKGNTVLKVLKTLVTSQLGSSDGVLGDFGFSNPKRTTPSEATKAAAVAKRAATRAARSTMGKKQKKSVTGITTPTTSTATKPAVAAPHTPQGA